MSNSEFNIETFLMNKYIFETNCQSQSTAEYKTTHNLMVSLRLSGVTVQNKENLYFLYLYAKVSYIQIYTCITAESYPLDTEHNTGIVKFTVSKTVFNLEITASRILYCVTLQTNFVDTGPKNDSKDLEISK